MIRGGQDARVVPLRRVVFAIEPRADTKLRRVEFDASPYGGGAVLYVHGQPVEYFALSWQASDAEHLGATPGDSSWQTLWEYLTLALALCQWASSPEIAIPLAVLGDNTSSLTDALALKGSTAMRAVSKEIAWRQARFGWVFEVGHLYGEANHASDRLSRLTGPDPATMPPSLSRARYVQPLALARFWQVQHGPPHTEP